MSVPASEPLSIVFGRATDPGKRSNNEDSSHCAVLAPGTAAEATLLIVSDGVGGSKAGEVASRMAVEGLHALLAAGLAPDTPPEDRHAWLDAAIRETDRQIVAAAADPELRGMGATVSVLYIAGRDAWWGQAGDSRIYLLRDGELRQLSHDHSPVGRMRAAGQLTEAEAREHPYRHIIDQCLGSNGIPVEPETGHFAVGPNDLFLLCSDGLSDGLWDDDIATILRSEIANLSPEEVATKLVARANEASGRDNITAVVAWPVA